MRARVGLGLAAGILLTLGLPPFGWWPLALGGMALLAWASELGRWQQRVVVGLAFGVGLLAPGLWWMTEFSLPGWVLAMLLESAMVAVAVAVAAPGRWRVFALPSALVVLEAVRDHWPFGGAPIATVAQTQIGGPMLEAARRGGALLVTALVGVVGVCCAWVARGERRATAACGLAVVVVVVALGAVAPDGRQGGALQAALVQGGGDRGTRAVDTSEAAVFRAHLAASDAVRRGVDLVLWPEDVVDVDIDVRATPEGEALAALARRTGATLVAGVVTGKRTTFLNEARVWEPDGRPGDVYEKNHRVPFGEYIPFRSLIDKVADVGAVPRDAHVGHGPGILRTDAGDLGVVVSYEVFFARRARAAVRAGGRVLLVPTNASSYSSTQMPALELGAARMRAVETGRDVLQAAPTGFSAVVDHRGRVRARSDLGRRSVLTATVHRRTGNTLYTRLGDGPLVLAAVAVLALSRWRRPTLARWYSSMPGRPRS